MRRVHTQEQAEWFGGITLSFSVAQEFNCHICFHSRCKPPIVIRFTVFLSAHQFRTIGISRSIKVVVLQLLKPIFITLASSSFGDIGIIRIHIMSAGGFGSTHIVVLLIKQRFRTMPMGLPYIGSFITGISKHIGKAYQAVRNTIPVVLMTIARHPILLRKCACHQHGTMRAAQRTSAARAVKDNTLLCQPVQIRRMHRVAYGIQHITVCRVAPQAKCVKPVLIREDIYQIRSLLLGIDLCSCQKSDREAPNKFLQYSIHFNLKLY